ncbi:MAG: hypothetical protein IPJ03_03140 [Ignavibacteriales bacterium]|nr:hypothetical protein [Ignavibacteriales bacterium]
MNSNIQNLYNYDLHGIVRLRLVNPSDKDLKKFNTAFGEYQCQTENEPDIKITFVNKIDTPLLTYIGLNNAAFDENGFYILSTGRNQLKVKIPFDKIGEDFEIVCESGTPEIPMLRHFINLIFLKKNYIPLHASAFRFNDQTALVMGWSKGGKTESLLAFANNEAEYIGDETVIISQDGKTIFGIPVSVCVWEWQFEQIPKLLTKLPNQKIMLFGLIHFFDALYKFLKKSFLKNSFPTKVLAEAMPAFKRQLNIRVEPKTVFKTRMLKSKLSLDHIILIMSHDNDEIKVENCSIDEVIDRMINSQNYEIASFVEQYLTFKYAFPNLKNELLENIGTKQMALLNEAFKNKTAHKVVHPYPVSFEKLFNNMKIIFERNNSSNHQAMYPPTIKSVKVK